MPENRQTIIRIPFAYVTRLNIIIANRQRNRLENIIYLMPFVILELLHDVNMINSN